MKRIWDVTRQSSFLRQNAVFFLGSVGVGLLNYAYYPVMSHLLPVSSYGEVQAIMSLFLQLLIFLTVLGQVTVNVVANYQDETKKQKIIYELEKLALFLSIALFVVAAVFGWKIKSFFHFNSVWPFLILMLSIVVTVPLAFRSAYLRGHKKFASVAAANLLSSASEIIISAVLVLVGWKTVGAVFGIVVAQFLAFLYAARAAYKIGFTKPENAKLASLPDVKTLRPELMYGLLVLCGSLTITVLSSADIFVVKHYFDAQTAGHYAGVSTVARIIFFLTASIAQVLLPSVKINQTAKHNRTLFLKSLALVLALGGMAALVFAVFQREIITVLMGKKYLTYGHLLGRLSLLMLVLSVLNLVVSYFVALRKYSIIIIVLLGAGLTFGLLAIFHTTLEAVIDSVLSGALAMLGMFGVWLIISKVIKKE
ncbi:MAG TPA: oligosaccharide flippase family protein [Candidatus Saccharimonadales bacterium]|nr:oligosaccharide flippase family protein [Candidatus Saccharimonadales bacterium]